MRGKGLAGFDIRRQGKVVPLETQVPIEQFLTGSIQPSRLAMELLSKYFDCSVSHIRHVVYESRRRPERHQKQT